MGTEFLYKLRAVTNRALRLTIPPSYPPLRAGKGREGADHNFGPDALFSRLASPKAELVRADASWQPKPPLIRIEIMASGPFDGLRGIRTAVNRLQHNLVTAVRRGTLELRLGGSAKMPTQHSLEPGAPGPGRQLNHMAVLRRRVRQRIRAQQDPVCARLPREPAQSGQSCCCVRRPLR